MSTTINITWITINVHKNIKQCRVLYYCNVKLTLIKFRPRSDINMLLPLLPCLPIGLYLWPCYSTFRHSVWLAISMWLKVGPRLDEKRWLMDDGIDTYTTNLPRCVATFLLFFVYIAMKMINQLYIRLHAANFIILFENMAKRQANKYWSLYSQAW